MGHLFLNIDGCDKDSKSRLNHAWSHPCRNMRILLDSHISKSPAPLGTNSLFNRTTKFLIQHPTPVPCLNIC